MVTLYNVWCKINQKFYKFDKEGEIYGYEKRFSQCKRMGFRSW